MGFVEPLSSFFADYGEEATWEPSRWRRNIITAIFDDAFTLTEGIIEDSQPAVTVQSSEVAGVAHEQIIRLRDTKYKIVGVRPDESGGTTVLLLEAV